jgi:Ca-activated chloride channel family protein
MRNASRVRILAAVSLAVAGVLAPRPVIGQSLVFKSRVDFVPLTVTVTDRTGRYVRGLAASDFAIFEEGQRQVISHFASGRVPVDMAFLLDTSGSMRHTLQLAQHAARGLVRQLREGDRAAVAAVGSTVSLHQSMTPDLARVDEALRSTRAQGNTALYDALYIVLRQYQQELRRTGEFRRHVLVLLSDGVDTASHVSSRTCSTSFVAPRSRLTWSPSERIGRC